MNKAVNIWNRRHPSFDAFFDFDKLFEDFSHGSISQQSKALRMEARVKETEDAFLVSMDMPGVKSEDLNIEVKDNVLSVKAERHDRKTEGESVSESQFTYQRQWSLPEEIDQEQLEAHLEHGVLNLALPKKEPVKAKTINIKEGGGPFLKRQNKVFLT